jgi:N-formylglutamate deformylase
MGAVYVKTSDEGPLREHLTPAERARLIELWYHPHHQRLTQTVDDVISDAKDCIIVDCDSFRRDRCLMNRTRTRFGRTSASEQTDGIHPTDCAPHRSPRVSGSRVFRPCRPAIRRRAGPCEHYRREAKVQAVMIEINRRLWIKQLASDCRAARTVTLRVGEKLEKRRASRWKSDLSR